MAALQGLLWSWARYFAKLSVSDSQGAGGPNEPQQGVHVGGHGKVGLTAQAELLGGVTLQARKEGSGGPQMAAK